MNIYIILENANRELEYKIILAKKLVIHGHKVLIGEKNELRNKIKKLPPGLIIEKGIRKGSIDRFKEWKLKGHIITCFDEEALTYRDDRQYFGTNCDKGIEKYVDIFFLASRRHFDTVKRIFHKKKLIIIGIPKFELLKKPLNKIFTEKSNEFKKKYGNYILITSRFGNVNYNQRKKIKQPISIYGNYFLDSKKIFEKFKLIPNIINKIYPQSKIIIRPHPSENVGTWKKIVKKNKNCEVIYDDFLYAWILGSKFTIQNRCSTGIEAFMLKKKVFSFDPYYSRYPLHDIFSLIGKVFTDLKSINKKNIENKKNFNKLSTYNFMQYYIHNVKKDNSFNLVVKRINKVSEKKLTNKKKINIKFSLRDRIVDFKNRYFDLHFGFKKYSHQKIGNFSKKRIKDILFSTDFFLRTRKKIKLDQVGKKIFLIQ